MDLSTRSEISRPPLRESGEWPPYLFAENQFDIAHASAVIEHVGSRKCQVEFLRELWRVARQGIFVTTPNRWFPVEFHTTLPLVYSLPHHQSSEPCFVVSDTTSMLKRPILIFCRAATCITRRERPVWRISASRWFGLDRGHRTFY